MPITQNDYLPKEQVFCCKKWSNGVLKKFYSGSPCARGTGAVRCDAPDPPKPPDGNGGGNGGGDGKSCIERCEDRFRTPGKRTSPGAEEAYRRCVARCGGDDDGDDDGKCDPGFVWNPDLKKCVPVIPQKECDPGWHWSPTKMKCVPDDEEEDPCRWGQGYKNAPGVGPGCDSGWHPVVTQDGEKWCCPDRKEKCDTGWHWDFDLKKCVIDTPQGPCSGEGHELPFGTSKCEEGFSIKKADDGNFWCCKDNGGGEDCDDGWHWDEDLKKCVIDREDNCPTGTHWSEYVEECVDDEDGDGNGGPGGEFKWGEDLQGLLARIMERANYLLDYPRGLTPQERQSVINYAIEGVKSGEAGEKQTKRDEMARIGMLGSGFQVKEMGRIERETRQRSGDVRRELAIDELDRRFQEIIGTTGMAQGLTGTLMESEKIPEILSGARRQEGQGAINAFLQYIMSGGAGGDSSYWQAIMSQFLSGNQGGGGGDFSWLYYLPYLTR
ncbi:hypothetical protein LCGC14_1741660 [marine sediment metagenome]|uniref:Uncharacterized protein n=1 Tax=marine sediment metagenome TaxID=412755 RepID=A0A0F9HU41_9ZZZZ